MSINTVQSGNYSSKTNDVIFYEGQAVKSLNILLQGKADVFISPLEKTDGLSEKDITGGSYRIFSLDENVFLGPNDLFATSKYSFSYRAIENCNIYAFTVQNLDQVKAFLSSQKDYSSYIISSIVTLINNSYSAYYKLKSLTKSLKILVENLASFYWALKENYGFPCSPSDKFFREGLDNLQKLREKNFSLSIEFNSAFFEEDHSDIYETEFISEYELNTEKIEYYKHLSCLPSELRKGYLSSDIFITDYHCKDSSKVLDELQSGIKYLFNSASTFINILYSKDDKCIFSEYVRAAFEMKKANSDISAVLQVIDYTANRIKEIFSIYENDYCHMLEIDISSIDSIQKDLASMDKTYFEIAPSISQAGIDIKNGDESIPFELENSAQRILDYSNIPAEQGRLFLASLEAFRNLKDKLSSDNEAREIRKSLTPAFFEIYEAVFKRVYAEKNTSRLYHMFLNFAYMDEKLLDSSHILNLYNLVDKPSSGGLCPVYSMRDWLVKIYEMEKDPSINEFEQDYFDVFRDMKKRRNLTDKDKQEYYNDVNGRLHYEIQNMFKTNQRLCHGHISVYTPILHNDMITRDLSKVVVTPEIINESIKKILEVDFSAFHREVSYRNPEKNIEKEFIMKAVFPDIVLMPIFGSRAFMWQEITGRNRNSPGRFIIPAFTDETTDDIIIKLVGNFRWELCRTMMGVSWNDITQKSLTSEYMDYIQFYKKNRDLSDEAKEKLKVQIQKYRSMARDIFTSDYETWINHESKGIIRLNKVSRGILYRHCPFSKSIRSSLEKQPLFTDMAVQFKNIRNKQAKEIENKYSKLVKSGISLDSELEENLIFFKDL